MLMAMTQNGKVLIYRINNNYKALHNTQKCCMHEALVIRICRKSMMAKNHTRTFSLFSVRS